MMKEIEISGANRFHTFTKTRGGSRAVIVRDGMILLSHEPYRAGVTPHQVVKDEYHDAGCEKAG